MPSPTLAGGTREARPLALTDQGWRLASSVSLRPEPFGALAYDFHTRQLSFLKTLTLVDVVRRLEAASSVAVALTEAGVPDAQQPAYVVALARLADTGLLQCSPTPVDPTPQEDRSA